MVVGVTPLDWLGLGSVCVLKEVAEVVDTLVGLMSIEVRVVLK